ncbi:hypothetical protein NQ156_12310 [Microbacterium sp. zg.Y625]|uniref:hypothetical protein n=1 Tax=Microbacterium jiangjiandongii TaxID=3049071 RepID=UPI00214B6AFC|nr:MULTISPECIES: hypothetical protein [unclassified Microbacterium]MCR2793848.1 hypothetical protein [Microbacterium sp. zg.Y625]MCR2816072.1 hypothetical protein [Microbacterium sp. zg.Y843]WIM26187.1 hypothetical protein QNO14_03790 [Microbacterium sp. zg-Y625]
MTTEADADLAVELSRLAARHGAPPGQAGATTDELLAAVTAFHDIARVSADLQGQAVRAAHEAGVSWAKIGTLLGTSRQAVQQRFDPHYIQHDEPKGSSRILGPVTRAEEMHHLAEAGAQGWRLIDARHGEHVLERDDEAWDITRVSVFSARPMPSPAQGWQAAATRFPDCFYIRPARADATAARGRE